MATGKRLTGPEKVRQLQMVLHAKAKEEPGRRFHALINKVWREDFLADSLDGLVGRLDNMTERRVVPGRVFTPSTLDRKDDLLLSVVAILLAAATGRPALRTTTARPPNSSRLRLRPSPVDFGRPHLA